MRAPTADFFLRPNLVAIPPSPFLGPKMEPKVVAAAFSDSLMASGFPQVLSLTQFKSVGLSKSRISVKKCVSYQTHNQGMCQMFFDGILRPLCLACYTRRRPCISDVPEATHEARLRARSETWMRDLLVGTKENKVLPNEGSSIPSKSIVQKAN